MSASTFGFRSDFEWTELYCIVNMKFRPNIGLPKRNTDALIDDEILGSPGTPSSEKVIELHFFVGLIRDFVL